MPALHGPERHSARHENQLGADKAESERSTACAGNREECDTDKKGNRYLASQNGKPCWIAPSILSLVQQMTPPIALGPMPPQAH
jgi:hypothetical protein